MIEFVDNVLFSTWQIEDIYADAYNKAIDDFVRYANTMPIIEDENGEVRPMWLEEMAERLKARCRE